MTEPPEVPRGDEPTDAGPPAPPPYVPPAEPVVELPPEPPAQEPAARPPAPDWWPPIPPPPPIPPQYQRAQWTQGAYGPYGPPPGQSPQVPYWGPNPPQRSTGTSVAQGCFIAFAITAALCLVLFGLCVYSLRDI